MNGFKPELQAGFVINTDKDILCLEMMLKTPDIISEGCIFSAINSYFGWATNKTITKSNIASIYINGQSITSATSINSYLTAVDLYHVVINLTSAITDKIYIGAKVQSGTWTNAGIGYVYSNIAIYPTNLTSSQVTEHYNLYTENAYSYGDIVSISMTETEVKAYDNDWQVVKSV